MRAAMRRVFKTLVDSVVTRLTAALAERLEPIVASAVERSAAARVAASTTPDAVASELSGPATEPMPAPPERSLAGASVSVAPPPSTLRSSGVVTARNGNTAARRVP